MTDNVSLLRQDIYRRISSLQEGMLTLSLDAIVLTSSADIQYFCGLQTRFWESPTRSFFLIIPSDSEPIAVVPSLVCKAFERATVMGRVETWDSPSPNFNDISLVSNTLRSLISRHGRIGMPLGYESILRMPQSDFRSLREGLFGYCEIVDCSPLLWSLRELKSSYELSRIAESCDRASVAFEKFEERVCVGMTQREVGRIMQQEMLQAGIDDIPFLAVNFDTNGYDDIISSGDDSIIRDDGVLFVDVGGRVEGYFCDFDRNFALGRVDDRLYRANEVLWDATEVGLGALREGRTLGEVWKLMVSVTDDFSIKPTINGRFGHGLGLNLTEPPSITRINEREVRAGLVLTIEPSVIIEELGSLLVHEENVAVLEGGIKLLTRRATREIKKLD